MTPDKYRNQTTVFDNWVFLRAIVRKNNTVPPFYVHF